MPSFLGFIFLLVPLAAFAGPETSGGGTGFKLPDGTVHLLDAYEAKQIPISLNLGTPGKPVGERVTEILQNWKQTAPARSDLYQSWFLSFYQETEWIGPDQQIDNPTDLGGVIVPANAQLVQLCFQRSGPQVNQPGQQRYVINKALFDLLSADDQVMLIIHELIYRDLMAFNMGSSDQVRYLTEQMLGERFNWHEYVMLMLQGQFGENEYLGVFDQNPGSLTNNTPKDRKVLYGLDEVGQQRDWPNQLVDFEVNPQNIKDLTEKGYLNGTISPDSTGYMRGSLSARYPTDLETCGPVICFSFAGTWIENFDVNIEVGEARGLRPASLFFTNSKALAKAPVSSDENPGYFVADQVQSLEFFENNTAQIPLVSLQQANAHVLNSVSEEVWHFGSGDMGKAVSFRVEQAGVKLRNGTGFALGSITLEAKTDPTSTEPFGLKVWTITQVSITTPSELPIPKVGDTIQAAK